MQLVIVGLRNFAKHQRAHVKQNKRSRRHSHSIKFFLSPLCVSFSALLQLIIIQFNSHFPHGGTEISNCAIRKALCCMRIQERGKGDADAAALAELVCLWWILIVLPVDAKQLSRRVHKQTKPNDGSSGDANCVLLCTAWLLLLQTGWWCSVVCLSLFDEPEREMGSFKLGTFAVKSHFELQNSLQLPHTVIAKWKSNVCFVPFHIWIISARRRL
jgi:hypothetical protein